jgi:cysteinyl-tRNA synthetase
MANVWMHNGFLQVEGEKMSKSLGNFVTINELLAGWSGRIWPGEALRFNMLRTHYRQPIDWTVRGLEESLKTLQSWSVAVADEKDGKISEAVIESLLDDLNTPKAIATLHQLKSANQLADLKASLRFLGFSGKPQNVGVITGKLSVTLDDVTLVATAVVGDPNDGHIKSLIIARLEARKRKDFAESDRIRDELAKMGISLKDTKNKETGEIETTWEVAR